MSGCDGTRIVAEIEHKLEVDGYEFTVTEIHWAGTSGLSFDVFLGKVMLTEAESLDEFPTVADIRALVEDCDELPKGDCKFCHEQRVVYRYHRSGFVCSTCWDDRLETTA